MPPPKKSRGQKVDSDHGPSQEQEGARLESILHPEPTNFKQPTSPSALPEAQIRGLPGRISSAGMEIPGDSVSQGAAYQPYPQMADVRQPYSPRNQFSPELPRGPSLTRPPEPGTGSYFPERSPALAYPYDTPSWQHSYNEPSRGSQSAAGRLDLPGGQLVSANYSSCATGYFGSTYPQSPASSTLGMQPLAAAASSSASPSVTRNKYSLYIRQQPRAARSGPEGRDRRPIDPPIILQLQILDFDPGSKEHISDLRYTYWVVHCYLFNNEDPANDVSVVDFGPPGQGGSGIRKLLIGNAAVNGLFAPQDPDPETAVPHPSSRVSSMSSDISGGKSFREQPGTFFIFSDLSIRSPGTYRLKFRLMRVDGNLTTPGAKAPIIAETLSNPFTVDNAKKFDKVQESTNLVRGLAKLPGAPSTLKIKKGPAAREKAKRRREGDDEELDSEEDDE